MCCRPAPPPRLGQHAIVVGVQGFEGIAPVALMHLVDRLRRATRRASRIDVMPTDRVTWCESRVGARREKKQEASVA